MTKKRGTIILDLRDLEGLNRSIKHLDKISRYYKDANQMLRDLGREIELQYIRPMMNELKDVPPRRKYPEDYPIRFTSDLQRRYVGWKLGGKPYQRRNRLIDAYGYKVRVYKRQLSVNVFNEWEGHKYVVGKIGLGRSKTSIRRYTKQIQEFHKTTGWSPAYKIVQKYHDKAKEFVRERATEWLYNFPTE